MIMHLIQKEQFYIKGKCNATMKKGIRSMEVAMNETNCDIIFAKCSCPAGESVTI